MKPISSCLPKFKVQQIPVFVIPVFRTELLSHVDASLLKYNNTALCYRITKVSIPLGHSKISCNIASLLCQPIYLSRDWLKRSPMRETQTSADRLDKVRDIEETPQLLLLAPGHFTTPSEHNIRVDKEADIPDSHWGELPVQWEGIWLTNDVLRGTHTHRKSLFKSENRGQGFLMSESYNKPSFTHAGNRKQRWI